MEEGIRGRGRSLLLDEVSLVSFFFPLFEILI